MPRAVEVGFTRDRCTICRNVLVTPCCTYYNVVTV